MLKKYREHRTQVREARAARHLHRIAMQAARQANSNAIIYRLGVPTTDDVINLAYGAHGVRLTDTEARDALAAELARGGRRLDDDTAVGDTAV